MLLQASEALIKATVPLPVTYNIKYTIYVIYVNWAWNQRRKTVTKAIINSPFQSSLPLNIIWTEQDVCAQQASAREDKASSIFAVDKTAFSS